jgi:NADH:ubiquinone oxidoreductase subunit 5 (subunit L)/multisubunit Na+/H+ antiporter MnhA subunit
MVFMGEQRMPEAREGSTLMVASVLSLAALSLAAGVLIAYPFRFSEFTVFQMLGMIK